VEEVDGIPLELLPLGLVAFDIRQAGGVDRTWGSSSVIWPVLR
jgi:hypothetical protein